MLDSDHVLWLKPGRASTRILLKLLYSSGQLPASAKPYKVVILKECAEDEHRDLNYDLFQVAILTERETRRIKTCYERLVPTLRLAILHHPIDEKKEGLKHKLRNYCEEFIELVDHRIAPHFWVAAPIKGHFLRLKADYLRYLFEIHPKCGAYQVRAHNAYTEAKAFFTHSHMTKTVEWFRLRLNYAALLYLDGFPTAAMFICQQLLKSNKNKLMDQTMEQRIRRNVEFFKRACLG
ncbi:unnamed protein product [Echinostoma caproni]|uniref:14_3_3 domain-containing protein n=1 Tax=Echinostoma caproni TaxID=27848 RepID=A0A183A876_9TREM|nr:unnamed protein product [Echinostoma caproni]